MSKVKGSDSLSLSPEEMIKIAAKVELLYREAKKDEKLYIQKYVKIEDRDAPEPIVPFDLWEGQMPALNSFINDRLSIVLKARQLGLSWLALAYASHGLVFKPGYSVVALSKREDEAKELVRRTILILKNLPAWLMRERKYAPDDFPGATWEATTTSVTINHPGSEPATFTSFTSSPDSARSFTASLVIIDEWAFQMYAREIWSAAYPTINRPTGGKVIGISTAKLGTFFEEVWKAAEQGKNKFKPIFLPWWTDPRRSREWYEDTKAELPHSYMQEYPATPEEAFSFGEMTAFPEFSRDIHVCKAFSIPEHWRRWKAVDNGYDDPFCWLWFTVSENGTVFVYREFTRLPEEEKLLYSDQAERVVELSSYAKIVEMEEKQEEEGCDFIVAGKDAWNKHHRDTSGKDLIDYYREGGIKQGFIPAVTDRRMRKSIVHEYLKPYEDGLIGELTAKLQIFDNCRVLIDTLPRLPKDDKDFEKVADCNIDHAYDALSYGLIAHHVGQSVTPEDEPPAIRQHKDSLATRKYKRRFQ